MEILLKVRAKLRAMARGLAEGRRFRENIRRVRAAAGDSSAVKRLIIDCGFNEGLVARRMLRELGDFSMVGFEVQQDLRAPAEEVKRLFPGRTIEVEYSAVSTKDGTIDYYEPEKWGKNYKGGTTTVGEKASMGIRYGRALTAPAVDFARWLLDRTEPDWFVFVKMDIEGAEYDVIEHLIDTGAIERVDVLAVEWHADKFPEPIRTRYKNVEEKIRRYGREHDVLVLDWF